MQKNNGSANHKDSKWTEKVLTDWNIRSFCDWLTIALLGIITYFSAVTETLISANEFCIPAWTKDESGNFKCGDLKNAAWTYPYREWSISTYNTLFVSWLPFLFLILFNIIYFNVSYYCNGNKNKNIIPNFCINTSLIAWCDVILRCMIFSSGVATLLNQLLKLTTGLPRPNAYTLLESNRDLGSVYTSFPSGHVTVPYCNTFIFGLYCHNAIRFAVRRKMKLNNNNNNIDNKESNEGKNDETEYFNGNYWFLLPIWDKLHYFHSICIWIAWSPLIFGATYIGITRIRDYWHSDTDCVAGALMGVACGYYFGYSRYYYEIYGIFKCDKCNHVGYMHQNHETHSMHKHKIRDIGNKNGTSKNTIAINCVPQNNNNSINHNDDTIDDTTKTEQPLINRNSNAIEGNDRDGIKK